MSYRAESERQGFLEVWFRDGSLRRLPRSYYDQIAAALVAGKDWFEAEDLYGDTVLIRLTAVIELMDNSPAGLDRSDAEARDERTYDRDHGEA